MEYERIIVLVHLLIDKEINNLLEEGNKTEAYQLHQVKRNVSTAIKGYYSITPVLLAFKGVLDEII